MKRVVMITPYYHPKIGGVVRHVHQLITHFPEGFSFTILTRTHDHTLPFETCEDTLRIIRFPSQNALRIIPHFFTHRIRTILREADYIHIHDPSPWVWSVLSLITIRKPFFLTLHGWEGRPPSRRDILIRKLMTRSARKTLCIGSFIQSLYKVRCDALAYNAPDSHRFTPSEHKPYITFFGRFDTDTAYHHLARIIPNLSYQLRGEGVERVILIGDGPLKSDVLHILREASIPFKDIGFTHTPEVYVNASLIVFPAGYQSILESLAAGAVPILLAETRERRAYLSTLPFAPCLFLLSSPHFSSPTFAHFLSQREACRRHIITAYTWQRMVETYLSIWGERVL